MAKMTETIRGLMDSIFGKKHILRPDVDGLFKVLTGYTPAFTTWGGEIYESELIRAVVDAKARHCSKLVVDVQGTAKPKLRAALRPGPNPWQTWSQFLYRLCTILEVQNNAWIVPVLDENENPVGIFPVLPDKVTLLDVDGDVWLEYQFRNGQTGYMELERCRWMTKFQYQDDFFGTGNRALNSTMELIHLQEQGISEGIKNSATFRFMAQLKNFMDPEDIRKERRRFNQENLQGESGGILLIPNNYSDVRQISQQPYSMDAQQMALIENRVYNYFGVNQDILQNKAIGDSWSAFFDGCLEPFAVQLSECLTRMFFSDREIAFGNIVTVTANRLQYASTAEKLNVSAQMADRGIMNRNEIRQIWGLPPIEGAAGEMYLIRGEYKDAAGEAAEEKELINDGT